MASNYLITGYWGEPHVTAENDRGIHAALFGTGRFVLPVGERFRAEYIGNNTVRIYDGKLIDNGAAAGIPAGEYVDLQISNAGQGMNRNDLIVFQYSQDASTLVESGTFVVIKGAEVSGSATDPELTQEDLLSGNATFDQMALWRVSVSATAISAPVQMFAMYVNPNSHIANKENPHGVTKNQIGLGNVPNVATDDQTPTFTAASTLTAMTSGEKLSAAFGKIAKAISILISHLANKENPHEVTAEQIGAAVSSHDHAASEITSGSFGVARGGTGKTTHTANAVLTGNGTSAVNNVATASGALYATAANSAPKFGVLPVAQGGTGSSNGATGLNNLLKAGNMTLSSYQYGTTLPTSGFTAGRIFFKKVGS